MSYLLVLQFPYTDEAAFSKLVALEADIETLLNDGDEVDGHDAGRGEMNIFIRTEDPRACFQRIATVAKDALGEGWLRAAFRHEHGATYEVLWPRDLQDFSVG